MTPELLRMSRSCMKLMFWLSLGLAGTVSVGAPETVEREAYLMGTLCTILGEASSREQGLAAIETGFSAIEATEALLSTWRPDTPLARLGQAHPGQAAEVPPELARLLAAAREAWEESAGGFDPAIGALVQAWDLRGPGRVPTPGEIAGALARSGMQKVVVDTSRATVTLKNEGLFFDAGGFGKGAGLARAGDALTRAGLHNWLINFGGQVLVDPDGPGRDIPVAHPRDRDRPVAILHLRGLSAATSSLGQRPGHILDPRSGQPAEDFGSVTIVGADPLRVDALATGLFVLGPDRGLARAESLPGVEALYLLDRGDHLEARATTGLQKYLVEMLVPPWTEKKKSQPVMNRPALDGGSPRSPDSK